MIRGIGLDIIKVNKFRNKPFKENESFYRNIFSNEEINYCIKRKDPYPHFAGKFAAKEAVIKAIDSKLKLNEINIKNKKNGAPIVQIKNYSPYEILVSITHEKDNALALSIFQRTASK